MEDTLPLVILALFFAFIYPTEENIPGPPKGSRRSAESRPWTAAFQAGLGYADFRLSR